MCDCKEISSPLPVTTNFLVATSPSIDMSIGKQQTELIMMKDFSMYYNFSINVVHCRLSRRKTEDGNVVTVILYYGIHNFQLTYSRALSELSSKRERLCCTSGGGGLADRFSDPDGCEDAESS